MREFLIILFCLVYHLPYSQIQVSETVHDFGDIYAESQSYVDIVFTNQTQANHYLLTIDKPRDVYYVFSSKKMLPDSSIVLRFKINDGLKGKFYYEVDVYTSAAADPITIILKGNVREANTGTSLTACPDFNSTPSTYNQNFSLVIKVIDSTTNEPIPNAKVYLVERGELVGEFTTNQKGIVVKNVPIGFYFITADKTPYASNYFEGYVNATRNYVEIKLGNSPPPMEVYEEPELIVEVETETNLEEPIVEEVLMDTLPVIIEETVEEPIVETPVEIPPLSAIPDTILDPNFFKYSNITFILDASSSMNAYGKLDLMKMSMIELVKMLRPEDNVTILKYAAEVDIVLEHTSGDKKELIVSNIKNIKTTGSTAGGDAIKTAYALNHEKYIQGGNNLVIIITDGMFNKGATDYDITIADNYKKHGTRFSVVGIKTTEYIAKHMETVVNKGGGQFIQINTIQDAQTKLVDELRRTAYKG